MSGATLGGLLILGVFAVLIVLVLWNDDDDPDVRP